MPINKRIPSRWLRVATMDRHELLDRGRQELGKRLDAIRYRLGDEFAIDQVKVNSEISPRFFFGNDEVPTLLRLLQKRFPREASAIVERAERICHHRFDLLGYEKLDYGAEIDWQRDQVHGKQAPQK